jgi:hypothetical protein
MPPSGARPGIETDRHRAIKHHLSVSNALSGRHWKLGQVPAVGHPTASMKTAGGTCDGPRLDETPAASRDAGRWPPFECVLA